MSEIENKTETKAEAKSAPKAVKTEAKVETKVEATETPVETKAETIIGRATAAIEDVRTQMKDRVSKATEIARDAYAFNRGNVETAVKAGQIFGEGIQQLATHAAGVTREQFDETVATLRDLAAARSLNTVVELQTAYARNMAKRTLTETTKLVEGYLKVTNEAIAPLTARALEAAERVSKAA